MGRRMSNRESLAYRAVIETAYSDTGEPVGWQFYGPYLSDKPPAQIIAEVVGRQSSWDPDGEYVVTGQVEVSPLRWMPQ